MRPLALFATAASASGLTAATEPVSTSPLLQFLAILLGSGGIAALTGWWRTRKTAPLDHDKLVQEITERAMEMNRKAIEQVNALSDELSRMRDQLLKTQRELRNANNRIAELEDRLTAAARGLTAGQERRADLEVQLAAALKDRDQLTQRVTALSERVRRFEAALDEKEPKRH